MHHVTVGRLGLAVVGLGSLAIACYSFVAYSLLPAGVLLSSAMAEKFARHPIGIYTHVFGSAVALLIGPLQFVKRIRDSRPAMHRWTGRIYLGVGVALGGVSALDMSAVAYAGPISMAGFACLALAWLFTGSRAYVAIRSNQIEAHQRWMIRNFALTFAAVMLRIYLPLSGILGIEFESAYRAVSWLCWVPNLVVAELIISQRGLRSAETQPQIA